MESNKRGHEGSPANEERGKRAKDDDGSEGEQMDAESILHSLASTIKEKQPWRVWTTHHFAHALAAALKHVYTDQTPKERAEAVKSVAKTLKILASAKQHGMEELAYRLAVKKSLDANAESRHGKTPLALAVEHEHLALVKLLCERCGGNPLHAPIDEWTPFCTAASWHRSIDIVKYFVEEANADLNFSDEDGNTPLHFAANSGNLKMVKYLVESGAATDKPDKKGNTPLDVAEKSYKWNVAKYLADRKPVVPSKQDEKE